MGIFKDRNGKTVRAGDTVMIETTYSGYYGQGQKCPVVWDGKTGRYLYEYKVAHSGGNASGLEDFTGVADFIKASSSDPA